MPLTSSRAAAPEQKAPEASPLPASSSAAVSSPSAAECVEIPFKVLFARLHPSVQAMPHTMPDGAAYFRLPLRIVHEQLPKGVIKIRMAQLREFSPSGVFQANPAGDGQEVELPLGEIIPRMRPEQFPARKSQRKVQAPDDIAPIFGPNGAPAGTVKVSEPRAKTAAEKMVEQPASSPAKPLASAPPLAAPSEPILAPAPLAPPPPPPPAPSGAAAEPAPPLREQAPIRAPGLDPALASLKPQPRADVFSIPFMDMASYWAAKGKNELSGLYRHTLEIPISQIEAGLKRGRLLFKWAELKTWIRLAPGTTLETFPDDLEVELPLQVVAPRFMERRGASKPRKRVEISRDIPDLFASKAPETKASENAGAAAISDPNSLATVPLPKPPAPATPSEPKAPRDYGAIFGKPEKLAWTLTEVVENCPALPGVSGAVIATNDGLLVAGVWPDGVKTESVAGFVPQMYSKMLQYMKELNLGNPTDITLLVQDRPLQIFRAHQVFFAVLGRAGETLPKVHLNAIAALLSQTSTHR